MANKNILIKRNNAGTIDVLYPQTIVTNLYDTNGTTALFDANKKLKLDYLPSYLTGASKGFYLVGSLSTSTDLDTLKTAIESGLGTYPNYSTGGGETPANRQGYSWVATSQIAISWTDVQDTKYFLTQPGDEGDATSPITIEVGDMIVFTKFVASTASESGWHFSIINNTYQDAGISGVKGIVSLSNATVTDSMNGSSKVITEDVLYDVIGTTAGKIAAGDHTHTIYQPKDDSLTNLDTFMTGAGSGFIKKTAENTYSLDTSTYLTTQANDFGNIAVTTTDSGHTYAATGTAAADSTSDTLTIVDGAGVDVEVSTTTDAIRIQHTDTSTLSGAQGSAGIASITVDGFGHVTSVTTATYNNYSLPLAAAGTRGGVQLGFTSTETSRALLLSSEAGYVTLPRQIPAVTLNGSSSTSPSFYAATTSGTTGSTSQVKQALVAQTGGAPVWLDSPVIYYDTTTGTTHGDIIFDEVA